MVERIEQGFEVNGFGLWALEIGGRLAGFTGLNRTTFDMPGPSEPCTRRSVEFMQQRAAEIYDTGEADSLMVVRACVVVDTITPFLSDVFRLSARSAFVNEPRE
jgi:hypothetical protein